MEGKYSIEMIEVMCANECDSNAQVTAPIEIEEQVKETKRETEMEDNSLYERAAEYEYGDTLKVITRSSAATNWLLFGIMCMLFLFIILRCD